MRTTVTIDDQLLAEATRVSGIKEPAALIRRGLETLIELAAAKRLALLGGSAPEAEAPPRRRLA